MRTRRHTLVLVVGLGACGGRVASEGPIGEEIQNPDEHATPVPSAAPNASNDAGVPAPEPVFPPAPSARTDAVPITCAVLRNGHIDTFTLPGARLTPGPAVALDTFDVTSMGRRGDALYACSSSGGDGVVVRIGMADGAIVRSTVACVAATADRHGIEILQRTALGTRLVHLDDWDDVVLATTPEAIDIGADVSRIAPFFDQIVGAWHSTRTLDVSARADGSHVAKRTLSRPSALLHGLTLVPDGRLLLTAGSGTIDVFDPFDGTWLERHGGGPTATSNLSAIACEETTEPRLDSCDDRADGVYCSEQDYTTAITCSNGALAGTAHCSRGSCQTDATGHAVLQNQRLECVPHATPPAE